MTAVPSRPAIAQLRLCNVEEPALPSQPAVAQWQLQAAAASVPPNMQSCMHQSSDSFSLCCCAVAEAAPPAQPAQGGNSKPVPSYVSVSDNYAVIDVGGVQHLVEEGRWYTCNRLNVRPGRPCCGRVGNL